MVWKSISPKRTGRKILKYTAEVGMTPQEVAAALGLSGSAIVYKWIEGRCLPSLENLCGLSVLFGRRINELL